MVGGYDFTEYGTPKALWEAATTEAQSPTLMKHNKQELHMTLLFVQNDKAQEVPPIVFTKWELAQLLSFTAEAQEMVDTLINTCPDPTKHHQGLTTLMQTFINLGDLQKKLQVATESVSSMQEGV
jgi:hypothetical protein